MVDVGSHQYSTFQGLGDKLNVQKGKAKERGEIFLAALSTLGSRGQILSPGDGAEVFGKPSEQKGGALRKGLVSLVRGLGHLTCSFFHVRTY